MVDFAKIRKNTILKEEILYLDFTASGLAYRPIEQKLQEILLTYSNTHSEVGLNSLITSQYYNNARESLRKTLEIGDDFYIIPCGTGATAAIKKFQELLGLYIPPATKKRYNIDPKKLPLVIVGPYEHHSNEVSFREALCEVKRVGLNQDETLNLKELENILKKNQNREIFCSFCVASNVTGIITPIKKIRELTNKYGATLCLDAATSSPYMNIDSSLYDVMFLSPHKLLGGVGSCGLLVIKKSLCNCNEVPTFAGGGTVTYVSRASHRFSKDVEIKEDAGTPGILQFIKASLAYELRNEIGLKTILKKEKELKEIFKDEIKRVKDIILYCSPHHEKLAIFSFNIKNIDPYLIGDILSEEFHIQLRVGCSCAGPYGHDLLNLEDNAKLKTKPGWIRVGFHFIHESEDIRYFVNSLKKSIKMAKHYKKTSKPPCS